MIKFQVSKSFLFAALLLMIGCSSTGETKITPPMSTLLAGTPSATIISMRPTDTTFATQPEPTISLPTMATNVDITKTLAAEKIMEYRQIEVAPSLPSGSSPSGSLVLTGQSNSLLHFNQNMRLEELVGGGCLQTSPDGKWLATCLMSNDSPTGAWLIVESADRLEQRKLPIEDRLLNWGSYLWLDNHRVIFILQRKVDEVHPMVVVNPFTGEQTELASDYPGIKPSYAGPVGTLQFRYSNLVYDPSLDLVVYPLMIDDKETSVLRSYIVLWNRQTQEMVARVEDLSLFDHYPLWSPSGEKFVVAVTSKDDGQVYAEDWFMVDRGGEISRLTNLAVNFTQARIGDANWSPDGKWLAFWVTTEPNQCSGERLAVLEMYSLRVINYCVPGSYYGYAPPPIWSLDSRYIVVENEYEVNQSQVILIDTIRDRAAVIAENARPTGWLARP